LIFLIRHFYDVGGTAIFRGFYKNYTWVGIHRQKIFCKI
jgi:hypothetical protein